MLTRIENECKYFHRDSLIFFLFFFFFVLEAGKYLFQIFFRVFEFRVVSIGKVHEKLRRTQRKQRTTSNVSLIHFLSVWCWVFYISIVKKENCLFGTVNIKGKWKTNQKNNNDNIFFFFLRPRNRLILNRWKLKNWRSTFVKKISKILAYDWNENLSRFREKGKRY